MHKKKTITIFTDLLRFFLIEFCCRRVSNVSQLDCSAKLICQNSFTRFTNLSSRKKVILLLLIGGDGLIGWLYIIPGNIIFNYAILSNHRVDTVVL